MYIGLISTKIPHIHFDEWFSTLMPAYRTNSANIFKEETIFGWGKNIYHVFQIEFSSLIFCGYQDFSVGNKLPSRKRPINNDYGE